MRTLGIDLSTDPRKTWICEVAWDGAAPQLVGLERASDLPDPRVPWSEAEEADWRERSSWWDPATGNRVDEPPPHELPRQRRIRDDEGLAAALALRLDAFGPATGRVAGIAAPLGWPVAFVDAIAAWQEGGADVFRKLPELRLRATDRFVGAVTRLTPMSVSTDRAGSTAMLAAELLARAAHAEGPRFDRARARHGIAEVHPAAALRMWTVRGGQALPASGYKTKHRARRELMQLLTGAYSPWEDARRAGMWEGLRALGITQSPDLPFWAQDETRLGEAGVRITTEHQLSQLADDGGALGALLCALVARSVAGGRCFTVDEPVEPHELYAASSPGAAQVQERAADAQASQVQAQTTAETESWIHVPRPGPLWRSLGVPEPAAPVAAPVADDAVAGYARTLRPVDLSAYGRYADPRALGYGLADPFDDELI